VNEGRKAKPVREVPFSAIERDFVLARGFTGGPAVWLLDDGSYKIRILAGESRNGTGTTTTWDFFHLAADGLVTIAPRGYAKYYKPARITGMEEAIAKYAAVES
jgi:hypothetical protein